MSGRDVPGHDHDLVGDPAVAHRHVGHGGHGERAGHAGHHGDGHARLRAGQDLLETAAEHIGVAALEPHDEPPCPGVLDQQLVDPLLVHRPPVRDLRRVDDLDVRRQLVEQVAGSEPVGDDDVRAGQQPPTAHGDQLGIARTTADQSDPGPHGLGVGRVHRHDPGLQRLDQRRPDRRGAARPATGKDPDGQPVVLADGGGDRGATWSVVGAHAEHAGPLGGRGDLRVDLRVVRGGERVPGAVEVAVAVGARGPAQLLRRRHAFDGGRDGRGDHLDVRTRCEQGRDTPLGDGAAADDDDPTTGENQAGEVGAWVGAHGRPLPTPSALVRW